jgi:hypothetical protein
MDTYVAPNAHRRKAARLRLVGDTAAFSTVRHFAPSPHETDPRLSPRASLAVIVLSSLGLWALIWFALTCLISNWP